MTAAMRFGCSAGMWLATGVLIGSLFWELLAAADLSIMIMAYRGIAAGIMMFGGFYLAFLSYRALHSFWRTSTGVTVSSKASVSSEHGLFLKGFAIHPTNPKSVLAWAAIIAIERAASASVRRLFRRRHVFGQAPERFVNDGRNVAGEVARYCPLSNLFRRAGAEIEENRMQKNA